MSLSSDRLIKFTETQDRNLSLLAGAFEALKESERPGFTPSKLRQPAPDYSAASLGFMCAVDLYLSKIHIIDQQLAHKLFKFCFLWGQQVVHGWL